MMVFGGFLEHALHYLAAFQRVDSTEAYLLDIVPAKLREDVAHVTGGFSQHVLLTCYISVRCGVLVTGYVNT
jgi:hypothetical protein